MTVSEQFITIALCTLATILSRFLPFIIFRDKVATPPLVQYLGKALPAATFAMLVVYCLRNVNFLGTTHGLPEILSITVVCVLHLWKRQMLLSIAAGTICYMLLIQLVFI